MQNKEQIEKDLQYWLKQEKEARNAFITFLEDLQQNSPESYIGAMAALAGVMRVTREHRNATHSVIMEQHKLISYFKENRND